MINEKLKKIKLVITDVDGVLTDGLLHYDANGEAIKSFHVRDGLGVYTSAKGFLKSVKNMGQ